LRNGNANRSYVFTYTISAANTWEQKSITIAGDTSGTWSTTNVGGIIVSISLGAGSTYSTTAGSWVAGNFFSATGSTSVIGTAGATFYITGVQLEKGSTATSFDYRPYGTELALCQRYYETKDWSVNTFRLAVVYSASVNANSYQEFAVTKRAAPTSVTWSGNGGARYISTVGINTSQTLVSSSATVSGVSVSSSATFAASTGWFDNAGTMQINAEL
jgi:hypothetical protein